MSLDPTLFLHWIATHQGWAGLAVFLIAFSESLALVGLVIPGTMLMFGTGAIVGAGGLTFWHTCAWAAIGAVAGDGLSFWLGRHYRERLLGLWPLRRHPGLVARAGEFVQRHGGKSILMGRFVGPIRPVIPAMAGMLAMPAGRFVLANLLSGLLWAPAYLLPGVVFGASLGLAAEVATRLALAVLVLLALLLALAWAVRTAFRLLHPRAHTLVLRILAWTRLHPVAGEIPAALLDPEHREARGLTLLALLLVLSSAAFIGLLEAIQVRGALANFDLLAFNTLQDLRTPWMDRVMFALAKLGDSAVLLPLFLVILGWLMIQRRWQAAAHWVAAAGFMVLLTRAPALAGGLIQPPLPAEAARSSFPSSDVAYAMAVYGFLAVLMARELADTRRWLPYGVFGTLIGTIAFSRLYLGMHWMSDITGGLTLGLAWVALLGIAYRRHPAATLSLKGLLLTSLATLLLATALHPSVVATRSTQVPLMEMTETQWWESQWRKLPAYRDDLRARRRQRLDLQYAGDLSQLRGRLATAGWQVPVALNKSSWLRWFGAGTDLKELPLLPQVHSGRHESLLLVKPAGEGRLWALRLWPADVVLLPGREPLWLGTASLLKRREPLPGFTVPRTEPAAEGGLQEVSRSLPQEWLRQVRRGEGEVLLIRP